MGMLRQVLTSLIASVIGIAVMVVLATVVFFIAAFVVSTGATLAGHDPSGDFVVLSAALIVVAIILTGGLTPRMSEQYASESGSTAGEDPAYD